MLIWDWKDKMGEVIYKDGSTNNIYKGNAYMISLHEHDGYYFPVWCFCDRDELKRSLGLVKDSEMRFDEFDIETIRLNTRYKHVSEIVSLLAKAKLNIKIELYYEEERKN